MDSPNVDLSYYKNYNETIRQGFDGIEREVLKMDGWLNNEISVLKAAELYFVDENELGKFESSFLTSYAKVSSSNFRINYDELTDFQFENIRLIVSLVNETNTFDEYKNVIQKAFHYIHESDISNEDKEVLLNFIIEYKCGLEFIEKNSHIIDTNDGGSNQKISGYTNDSWWDKWGKCAAGTIGSALTTGLTGALGGSAVPAIGTVIGGVVGAIGGGLAGAAVSCDSALSNRFVMPNSSLTNNNSLYDIQRPGSNYNLYNYVYGDVLVAEKSLLNDGRWNMWN